MSLLIQIKKDQLQSRKDRDIIRSSLLTTLIGTLDLVSKNVGHDVTDNEVIAEIKKFIKNVEEVIKHGTAITLVHAIRERALLEAYLPKQMTEEELRHAIGLLVVELNVTDSKGMGKIMGALKSRFEGTYDGALASKIVKEALQ
jgi:uncharacterized protein YqeY